MRKALFSILIFIIASYSYGQKNNASPGYDAIIEIVEAGDTSKLSKILSDYQINLANDTAQIPYLFYACSKGNIDMVYFLLEHGADPNVISEYGTAANWAAERRNMNVINTLLDSGFNPRIEEMSYWVCQYNSGDSLIPEWMNKIVKEVLKDGVDYKNYPFMEYTDPGDPLLLSASIYCGKDNGFPEARRLIDKGVNVDLKDKNGLTALHYSISMLDTSAVLLLIKSKANVNLPLNSKEYYNLTPLNLLLYSAKKYPDRFENNKDKVISIARILVEAGADANTKAKIKDSELSALQVAKEINNSDIIKIVESSK
jgi:ankyrin repeat protein